MESNEAIWIKSYIFFTALDPGLLSEPPARVFIARDPLVPCDPGPASDPEICSDHGV